MSRVALRVDVPAIQGFKQKFISWVSKFDGYIVAHEAPTVENKHVHCIIETKKSEKAFRSAFVREFPECVGNKGYSLKVCDDDYEAYIRYICKGESEIVPPDIWACNGLLYGPQVVEQAHKKYYVNQAAVIENRKKEKEVSKLKPVELVERECKRMGVQGFDREGIAKMYLRLWRDARKPINVYAARAVVNSVCLCLSDSCEQSLASKIAEV